MKKNNQGFDWRKAYKKEAELLADSTRKPKTYVPGGVHKKSRVSVNEDPFVRDIINIIKYK